LGVCFPKRSLCHAGLRPPDDPVFAPHCDQTRGSISLSGITQKLDEAAWRARSWLASPAQLLN